MRPIRSDAGGRALCAEGVIVNGISNCGFLKESGAVKIRYKRVPVKGQI